MAMSWHMMVEFTPPLVACVVSDADYSFAALRATRECVIAVPAAKLAKTVVAIGNCSGRTTDKFAAFGLTRLPARCVAAPLVAECFANLECEVADTRFVRRYGLFILEVVQAWRDPTQTERQDDPPSRPRRILRRRRDDQARFTNAMIAVVRGEIAALAAPR